MATATLSVRLDPQTRRVLAEAASTHDAAGASALAREILQRWAAETLAVKTRESVARAIAYTHEHPDWADEPETFFSAETGGQ